MAITEHVKRSSLNMSTGEVVYTYYTDTEWSDLQAAKESKRVPAERARLIKELRASSRLAIDLLGDEYTRTRMLMQWTELRLMGSLTPEETAELAALTSAMDYTKAVQAECLRVEKLLVAADEPTGVPVATWPAKP